LLIPWITAFQRRNPELVVNLTLTLGPVHIIPPECDIRINHGLYPCSNAVIRKLGEMRRMMVASAGYLAKHGAPKTPEDLEFHELLGGNDLVNGAPLVLLKNNERVLVPIHSKLRLKDHTAARTAALSDAGISVHAFCYDTLDLVRRKQLIHVLPEWEPEPSPVSLLLPVGRKPTSAVEALCDFISEKWRSNPELIF
jgi:putative lysR substrate binding domain protein